MSSLIIFHFVHLKLLLINIRTEYSLCKNPFSKSVIIKSNLEIKATWVWDGNVKCLKLEIALLDVKAYNIASMFLTKTTWKSGMPVK